jgi:hypothetical protein
MPHEPPGNRRPRWMVTLDRIRLTGLLQKKPWKRGFFYACCFTGDSSGSPRGGPDGGFMEPLGAVARRGLLAVPATSRSARGTLPRTLAGKPKSGAQRRAAVFLGEREVLEGGTPVAQFGSDWLEVARASKFLGAEAFGRLACELRDVTLLGCLDEDSRHAERLQLGRSRSAAFRIPLDPRHVPNVMCSETPQALGRAMWRQPVRVIRNVP